MFYSVKVRISRCAGKDEAARLIKIAEKEIFMNIEKHEKLTATSIVRIFTVETSTKDLNLLYEEFMVCGVTADRNKDNVEIGEYYFDDILLNKAEDSLYLEFLDSKGDRTRFKRTNLNNIWKRIE